MRICCASDLPASFQIWHEAGENSRWHLEPPGYRADNKLDREGGQKGGYKTLESPESTDFYTFNEEKWCPEEDSNLHALASAAT